MEILRFLKRNLFDKKMIVHFHRWPINLNGVYDETSFALIECDRQILKKLFDFYWFSLAKEQRFEIYIMDHDRMPYLLKWSRRSEEVSQRAIYDLLRKTILVIDNMENGFNYSIATKNPSKKIEHAVPIF